MNHFDSSEPFAPIFEPDSYSDRERWHCAPFFTNLDKSVYAALIFAPELIGALCSRASRATGDLRMIYLREYLMPFVEPTREEKDTDEAWKAKTHYGASIKKFIEFLHSHPILDLFANPRARSFYAKWLAEYGDDSIAQMAGAHLIYCGISQVCVKHFEDQRIGIAPIEKSTRYVDYSKKVGGQYLYYTDPALRDAGLHEEYRRAMDGLFETYARLIPKMTAWLTIRFPEEKPSVIEKKAFDTVRGLLPTSVLSQVAFFGNGQAFEYLVSRSLRHHLGEIRWAGNRAYEELFKVTPSFLRRIKDDAKRDLAEKYQTYLSKKKWRMHPLVNEIFSESGGALSRASSAEVRLLEYDPDGEAQVITGMLYEAPNNHRPWEEILVKVAGMGSGARAKIIDEYLRGRTERWQKVGRAFENAIVRWEITMNIGAWRDLHRHRMLTQQRQNFSCYHGYDVPREIIDAGIEREFRSAIAPVEEVFEKIAARDLDLAQYAVTLAHRIRFMQRENLRQSFWQIELRSIPEGHPDYRRVAQEKFWHLERAYPLIAAHIRVNMGEYDFARRGQEEKIQEKLTRMNLL